MISPLPEPKFMMATWPVVKGAANAGPLPPELIWSTGPVKDPFELTVNDWRAPGVTSFTA